MVSKARRILYKIRRDLGFIFKGEFKKISYSYTISLAVLFFLIGGFGWFRVETYNKTTRTTILIRKLDAHARKMESSVRALTRLQLSSNQGQFNESKVILLKHHENYLRSKKSVLRSLRDEETSCGIKCLNFIKTTTNDDLGKIEFKSESSVDLEKILQKFREEELKSSELATHYELNVLSRLEFLQQVDLLTTIIVFLLLLLEVFFVFIPSIKKLTRAVAIRSEFLSKISHEIRNPMNTIIGMADVLRGTDLNIEQKQYVRNINRAGKSLLGMLDHLIDFAGLEGRKIKVKRSFFNLELLIERCIDVTAIKAHQKGIEVFLDSPENLDYEIKADEGKLEQILMNLLSNAVKFTEKGFVKLRVTSSKNGDDSTVLKFEVIDTGIGIRDDRQKSVFQSFVQADFGIKRKYGGSGLGLSISNELLELMGSRLGLESKEGKGSNFNFSIKVETKEKNLDFESSLKGEEISIICSEEFIEEYESSLKSSCIRSYSQIDEKLRDIPRDSVVFVDDSIGIIPMLRVGRFLEKVPTQNIYGVIKSCFSKEDIDLLEKNDFRNFIIKPLKPWKIDNYLSSNSKGQAEKKRELSLRNIEKVKKLKLRILVVDDGEENLYLLKEFLKSVTSDVLTASDGKQGLEIFQRGGIDIVFMDLQMPVMDGYSAVYEMAKFEKKKGWSTPKYALTAHAGEQEKARCLKAGFKERLLKPIRKHELIDVLMEQFGKEELEGMKNFSQQKTVDEIDSARIIQKLLPRYIKARVDDIEEMKELINRENYRDLGRLGHKIKGSALSYGFKNMGVLGKALEDYAKEENYSKSLECIREMERIIEKEKGRLDSNGA